ncbi:MAG: serine/threonine-protein kinase [Mastigocoleus sp. MO_167.B18]|nr:serine/threonine-protein kinase [Mastigocoleus sp. MO_167.B18]
MAEEPTYTLTKENVSGDNQAANQSDKPTTNPISVIQPRFMSKLGHFITVAWTIGAAFLSFSGNSLTISQSLENRAHASFYTLRQKETPPKEIIILEIDDNSISLPRESYLLNPKNYSHLKGLKSFPYKREVYAQVIDKLIAAGARHVALHIVFDSASSYGANDDQKLASALKRHGSKVTLATLYQDSQFLYGTIDRIITPLSKFQNHQSSVNIENFLKEKDGEIHRLSYSFVETVKQQLKEDGLLKQQLKEDGLLDVDITSFDRAVLRGAKINYPEPLGDRIYFYGPPGTFERKSFWEVFDPEFWDANFDAGKIFKDKIVLIGATGKLAKQFPVPVSNSLFSSTKMFGVEIHANAIATLMEGKAIAQGIESNVGRGLFTLCLVGGIALFIAKIKRGTKRFFVSILVATTWGGITYALFFYGKLIFPTAVPIIGIIGIGFSYLGVELTRELIRKSQLVDIFRRYSTSQVVREILSQQEDLKDLIYQRQMEISGKILDARYRIVKVLGAGGFSETYIAEDCKRPGNPLCVVKQLKPVNDKPAQLEVARRLFNSEAKTLEKLGKHNQIPQLLAYFEEEEEFYLVQEYIMGHPLSREIPSGKILDERTVIHILKDLLQVLEFVHANEVIHRDIKPSNIIRRESDRKLVLIDFGAVKDVTSQSKDELEQTSFTIGIGTKGYAPSEQCFGRPQYNSDIYAAGTIAIKALTGKAPHEIPTDGYGELKWTDRVNVSPAFAKIISKMVLNDYKRRYQSVSEVLSAIAKLGMGRQTNYNHHLPTDNITLADTDIPTTPWVIPPDDDEQDSTSMSPTDE